MKIIPDFHNINTGSTRNTIGSRAEKNSGRFSSILNQTVETQGSCGVREASHMTQSAPVFANPVISPGQAHVLSTGEQALDLLEHCGSMLGNDSITGGMLEQVAKALDGKVQDLMQVRNTMDHQNPLRGAMDEIGAMSVVASMKIERGDFSG